MERKKPSKEALDNCVKVLIPYIIEMIKEDKRKDDYDRKT